MKKQSNTPPSVADKKELTLDDLFVMCVSDAMREYVKSRNEYEEKISQKGYRLRRGAFERITWNSKYIAEQYKLCLMHQCNEPATIRNLIVVIGDNAVARMNNILAEVKAKTDNQPQTQE